VSEILARLNAKPNNLESQGRATGEQQITNFDIVCTLNKLQEPFRSLKTEYARCKFTDLAITSAAYRLAHSYVVRKGVKEGWAFSEVDSRDTIKLLAHAAIEEAILERRCRHCQGTGNVAVKNQVNVCPVCKGSGQGKSLSIRKLSKQIKTSEKRARTYWKPKFDDVLREFLAFDAEIQQATNAVYQN
jgi:hypothetical protein